MSKQKATLGAPVLAVIAAPFVLGALAIIWSAWGKVQVANAPLDAECEIVARGVHMGGDLEETSYHAEVTLRRVGGDGRTSVDRGPRELTQSDAYATSREHEIGDTVACRDVDGQLSIYPRSAGAIAALIGFGIFLLVVPVAIAIGNRRGWFGHKQSKKRNKRR